MDQLSNATEKFDRVIYSVRDSAIAPFDALAQDMSVFIHYGQIPVGISQTQLPVPVKFDLHEFDPKKNPGQYIPTFQLDLPKFSSAGDDAVKSHLVGALVVAKQFTTLDYADRLSTVYDKALDAQTSWLQQGGSIEPESDPQLNSRASLVRTLLGDMKYFADSGFKDYQTVLDEILSGQKSLPMDKRAAQELYNDKAHFIAAREQFTETCYENIMKTIGAEFLNLDTDKRAYYVAAGIAGISIFSKTMYRG